MTINGKALNKRQIKIVEAILATGATLEDVIYSLGLDK